MLEQNLSFPFLSPSGLTALLEMKSCILETLLGGTWRRFRVSSEFPLNPVLDGILSILYSPMNPWLDVSDQPGPLHEGTPIGDVWAIASALLGLSLSIVVCLKVASPIGCPLQCMDCQGLEWRGNSWRNWSWPQWKIPWGSGPEGLRGGTGKEREAESKRKREKGKVRGLKTQLSEAHNLPWSPGFSTKYDLG